MKKHNLKEPFEHKNLKNQKRKEINGSTINPK